MWLLEHESLNGKREWLRPGGKMLFGRPSKKSIQEDRAFHCLNHGSISRKHMMLRGLEVEEGEGTILHNARPGIEVTDLSCRQTVVDGHTTLKGEKPEKEGEDVRGESRVFNGEEHTIRLSQAVPDLRLKWCPVVITFASKAGKQYKDQIHALGIKTSDEFVHGHTTHVVSAKRNLPKVLQGLLAGAHIVSVEFLTALVAAATPQNPDPDNYMQSKLETDFDAFWPAEKDYIPAPGNEPVARPGHMLEPDIRRSELFAGMTIIFLSESQYNSLSKVISSGGGKPFKFDLELGETTVDEFVQFAKGAIGQKKGRRVGDERLPFAVVRLAGYPEEMENWVANFITDVDKALNQHSINQNTFLDAIITRDIASLQQPVAATSVSTSAPVQESTQRSSTQRPTTQISASQAPLSVAAGQKSQSLFVSQPSETTPAETEQPVRREEPAKVIPRKRPARRPTTQSRFTGFDDYEPPSKTRKIAEEPMEDVQVTVPTQNSPQAASQPQVPIASAQASQRRAPPVIEPVEKLNEDELFPATAALRKRRAAAAREGTEAAGPVAPVEVLKTKGEKVFEQLQKMKSKVSKEIDVREQVALRNQQEQAKREAEEERLHEALDGMDLSKIKDLVQVEEMEIKPRPQRAQRPTVQVGGGEGWKDEWNGRKNFKKFRRRGTEEGPQQPERRHVPLEEEPQKRGFGKGDPFFLDEPEPEAEKDKGKGRQSKGKQAKGKQPKGRPPRALDEESDSEPEQGFTRTRRREETSQREVVNVEDSMDTGATPVASNRPTASNRTTQRVAETQLSSAASQSQRKRPPGSAAAGQPPAKKSRPVRRADDDSDAEETGFRFRRKR